MSEYLFTSESVTEGHPDKTCDIISDTILQHIKKKDPNAKVAVETFLSKDLVIVGGEVTTEALIDYDSIIRKTILDIGFNNSDIGLDGATCSLLENITTQSPEIAKGVFNALEGRTTSLDDDRDAIERQGAGDQGIIFGYANKDNNSYFPAAGKIAHLLTAKLTEMRRINPDSPLLPDGKSQVTLRYVDGKPVAVETVLISTQHKKTVNLQQLQSYVQENIIVPVLEDYNNNHAYGAELTDEHNYLINPAGEWNVGSSASDTGLTGRKIIVDSYCGYAKHGGGCYSGKDFTKTDRSAAYALRYVAKNLVAAGAAEELELQISYAIGSSKPVSLHVDTKGKRSVGVIKIEGIINELFDLRPGAIIRDLQLNTDIIPIAETARNGHFGRNPHNAFTWERLDLAKQIQDLL